MFNENSKGRIRIFSHLIREAPDNFIVRKRRQIGIYRARLAGAEDELILAHNLFRKMKDNEFT